MPRFYPTVRTTMHLRKILSYLANQALHNKDLDLTAEKRAEVWEHLDRARKSLK